MSFESTEKYQAKLESIRKEPQETEEQKAEKKEHAKEFRQEVMLDNARLMSELTAQFEYNWWATQEDLEATVRKSAEYLAHPEVAENFINDLIAARKRVDEVIEKTKKGTVPSAEQFYRQLSSRARSHKPKGKIELDASYPLAVVLFVENDGDFAMVDDKENVGGFYRASASFVNFYPREHFQYPIMVIRGHSIQNRDRQGAQRIEQHERGHAEHERLISALEASDKKTVWFKEIPKVETVETLKQVWGMKKTESRSKFTQAYDGILNYALERAKDELLAEFKFSGMMQDHLASLKKKSGVYDYFEGLDIEPNSKLYKDLWKEYEQKLENAVSTVDTLLTSYQRFDLRRRSELMRWVLAQIPLKDWEKQLQESAFYQEATSLNDIYYKPPRRLSDEESRSQIGGPLTEFYMDLSQNQSRSLLPQIRKFQEAISVGDTDGDVNIK